MGVYVRWRRWQRHCKQKMWPGALAIWLECGEVLSTGDAQTLSSEAVRGAQG